MTATPLSLPTAAEVTAAIPCAELMMVAHEYEQAMRLDDAARILGHILKALPDHARALHLMGVVAFHKGQKELSLSLMERAIACGIDTPLYYRNIGEVYRVLGRHEQARDAARRSVALNPGDPIALMNCGVILADQGLTDEAIACFEEALAINGQLPAAHFGLAEALLSKGEFARGWQEYEWRFKLPGVPAVIPKTKTPQWDGAPIVDGVVLLIADQGFGDAIQFCRYIPWVAARAAEIVVACSPVLQPILRQLHPNMRLVSDWKEVGPFAAWVPLSGLPRLAGTVLETIPAEMPYLRAAPERIAAWKDQLDALTPAGLKRVGVVWAGRPAHKNDWKRSMTLEALAPVAALDGIALVVLQKGPEQRQTGSHYGHAPLVHLSAEVEDFEDTMAIMAGLDLVLTVDTSVAHLAGAMGCPVWIMLPWCSEWRWLQERGDSPWYPTARLFRQPGPNDWRGAAEQVAEALKG
ncbi:MAG: Tetratricopeptide repeat family protein [Rhodospirillales bacterium]|nr:Tetratricopeptide repeat family protein [Rhodospirillales bacterium]